METKFEDMTNMCESSGPINSMPFNIEFDGKANVETRFNSLVTEIPNTEDEKHRVLSVEFRGKPLQGRELKIPSNYEGLVATDLKQSSRTQYDKQISEKTLRLTSKFNSFTYWNWDKPPSGMDSSVKLLDWMNLADTLHAPVEFNPNQENERKSSIN